MKTNRAIFWATIAIINTLGLSTADGPMVFVGLGTLSLSLIMLHAQTRERRRKVSCVGCGREIRIFEEGITVCWCGVKHTWHHSE